MLIHWGRTLGRIIRGIWKDLPSQFQSRALSPQQAGPVRRWLPHSATLGIEWLPGGVSSIDSKQIQVPFRSARKCRRPRLLFLHVRFNPTPIYEYLPKAAIRTYVTFCLMAERLVRWKHNETRRTHMSEKYSTSSWDVNSEEVLLAIECLTRSDDCLIDKIK